VPGGTVTKIVSSSERTSPTVVAEAAPSLDPATAVDDALPSPFSEPPVVVVRDIARFLSPPSAVALPEEVADVESPSGVRSTARVRFE
jgi:hypothetical protein